MLIGVEYRVTGDRVSFNALDWLQHVSQTVAVGFHGAVVPLHATP
jgi:hypothetical protein